MDKGLALYKRDGVLYLLPVAYEYPDNRFVGFSDRGEAYRINKLSEKQKDWLKTNDPKKNDKTKNCYFVGDYYYYPVAFKDFPKGKPYTQLPGGGALYKITRQHNFIPNLFNNKIFLRALDKHANMINENNLSLQKTIEEEIRKIIYKKNIENPTSTSFGFSEDQKPSLVQKKTTPFYTAAFIENKADRNKLDKIYNLLDKKGKIPIDFKRPMFEDGTIDYHMTITLGELPNKFKVDLDKDVNLNVVSLGVSSDAIALGVSGDYFSKNEKQHITIAFKDAAVESNNIKKWHSLKKPFSVTAVIRECDEKSERIKRGVFYSGEDVVDEANQIQIGNFPCYGRSAGQSRRFPSVD